MLSPGIIILFDGNHASIPAGWTRETSLDGKFPKSSGAENPNVTGGSATHSHTSPAHTHALTAHTHTYSLSQISNLGTSSNTSAGDQQVLIGFHSHTGTSGTSSGGTLSDTLTYGEVSNNPEYYEFIPIISGGYNFIPVSGAVLSKNNTRSGLTFHTGSANKFIRFAGTGNNAGTTGGTTTNTHNIGHSHTPVTHTHVGATSGGQSGGFGKDEDTGTDDAINTFHTHTITLDASSQLVSDFVGSLVTAETVEPAYATLNAYKNDGASAVLPAVGDVALWLGSHATIPVGWALCDGNNGTPNLVDKFIKLNPSAGASTTGGSNTHTHSAQTHSHSSNGTHTHTGSGGGHVAGADSAGSGDSGGGVNLSHTVQSVSTPSTTYGEGTTTADSSANQPEYRTVAYIQLQFLTGGSAITKMIE